MTSNQFKINWLNIICKGITKKQIEKAQIGTTDGYLWHAFSYGLVPCFEGSEARSKYDAVSKAKAFEIHFDPKIGAISDSREVQSTHTTSEGIDTERLIEFYVVANDFSWCYVRTHEDDCGPYFCLPRIK